MQIIPADININFMRQARLCASISALACVAAIVLMFVRGFVLGVDFSGGTVFQLRVAPEAAEVDEGHLRSALAAIDQPEATVVRFGPVADRSFLVTVPASLEENKQLETQVLEGLERGLGGAVTRLRTESIGPRVGTELARAAIWALVTSWILILAYVWLRFDIRYAPGAVIALIHDTLITAGVFVALGLEFDLNVIAALLTIIGYSLNDTIVIYDRVRENLELRGTTHLEEVVNKSVNQTLSRTILTAGTVLVVVVALLFVGGPVLFGFSFAMLIGCLAGTYSTVYVATLILVWLERRFPVRVTRTA